jgi:hypothetical protein
MASIKKKYLGINLTKEVKDLYSEIYKALKKVKTPDGKTAHVQISI